MTHYYAQYTKKSQEWRKQNSEIVSRWKEKYAELVKLRFQERWDAEKFETEIGSSLFEKELQDIWYFASSYAFKHSHSKLGRHFTEVMQEIKNYGTIEPSRKRKIMRSIETTGRKMNAR